MSKKTGLQENISKQEELITFTDEEVETIKRTVAQDANKDELNMFMHIAKSYGLDPFNKEIFFWKVEGRPIIMTSRDGYLKIADRHPEYDGLVSDVVRENDSFRRKVEGIEHEYGTKRGAIIGAYALVYRKDRRYPVYVFAPYEEYKAHTRVWTSYPTAMILKVAESMALKRAFTVSGLVSQEEMEVIQLQKKSEEKDKDLKEVISRRPVEKSTKSPVEGSLTQREEEIKELIGTDQKLKNDLFSYLEHIKKERGVQGKISLDALTPEEYSSLYSILKSFKRMDSANKPA